MPVVALTERGLIIDVFGVKPTKIKSECFKTFNNHLVSVYRNTVRFIDLMNLKDFKEATIPSFSEMKLSKNGANAAFLCFDKKLQVFKESVFLQEFTDVEVYDISAKYFAYSTEDTLYIFNILTNTIENSFKADVKSINCFNTVIFVVIAEKESKKLCAIENGKVSVLLELPNIFRVVIEQSEDTKDFLVLVDIEYSKNCYYAESKLYFIRCNCNYVPDSGAEEKEPKFLSSINNYSVFVYNTLRKTHCFGFLGEMFYVCYGNQPANLHLYSKDGEFIKNYKKSIRNKVAFSRDFKKVINAGFGNLPGNIEVCVDDKVTCNFDSLGSSVVEWLNNSSHFIVATTNYFKSDNKITVYDYYGRCLEQMDCSNLISVAVYGDVEDELEIEKPEDKIIKKKEAQYVPPHIQAKSLSKNPSVENKKPQKPKEKPVKSLVDLEQQLIKCTELKKRMGEGEELSLEEQNMVFSMKSISEEIEKLKK